MNLAIKKYLLSTGIILFTIYLTTHTTFYFPHIYNGMMFTLAGFMVNEIWRFPQ